jgi:hypothetical protein
MRRRKGVFGLAFEPAFVFEKAKCTVGVGCGQNLPPKAGYLTVHCHRHLQLAFTRCEQHFFYPNYPHCHWLCIHFFSLSLSLLKIGFDLRRARAGGGASH